MSRLPKGFAASVLFPSLSLGMLFLASTGCEEVAPTSSRIASSATNLETSSRDAHLHTEYRKAVFRLVQQEARWAKDWPRPDHWSENQCPADSPQEEANGELLTRVIDARWERKSPLPMSLTQALSTAELNDIRNLLGQENARTAGKRTETALEGLTHLESITHAAVFHVIHHEPARVIHKLGQIRPEWVPGVLSAWLVIHRANDLEPLCQTQIVVQNQLKDAPLSRRLRPELMARFERELYAQSWAEAKSRLTRISRTFHLPAAPVAPQGEPTGAELAQASGASAEGLLP